MKSKLLISLASRLARFAEYYGKYIAVVAGSFIVVSTLPAAVATVSQSLSPLFSDKRLSGLVAFIGMLNKRCYSRLDDGFVQLYLLTLAKMVPASGSAWCQRVMPEFNTDNRLSLITR